MSMLNKTLVKPLNLGLNTVTLTNFKEYDAETKTLDNGDIIEFKAFIALTLTTADNKTDTHRFYFTGNDEQDTQRLSTLINAITEQTKTDKPTIAETLEMLKETKSPFKVLVSEKPSTDGKTIYRNYNYSLKLIALASL